MKDQKTTREANSDCVCIENVDSFGESLRNATCIKNVDPFGESPRNATEYKECRSFKLKSEECGRI